MSDLQKYINKRKRRDPEFADGFDAGYSNFKLGVLLKQAREKVGGPGGAQIENREVSHL